MVEAGYLIEHRSPVRQSNARDYEITPEGLRAELL
jgi:hypothetical protein